MKFIRRFLDFFFYFQLLYSESLSKAGVLFTLCLYLSNSNAKKIILLKSAIIAKIQTDLKFDGKMELLIYKKKLYFTPFI
jgi:hypothetical protein